MNNITINEALTQLREDLGATPLHERVIELNAMIRLCDILTKTGYVNIPAVIYGGLMAMHGLASHEIKRANSEHVPY